MSILSMGRLRRKCCAIASITTVLLLISVAVGGSPAQAKYALLPGHDSNHISYKGCRVYAAFEDYGLGNRLGYSQAIVVKHIEGTGPKGCSLETDMEYEYWSSTLHRNVHSRLTNVYKKLPGGDVFLFRGIYKNQGLKITKGSIAILCRSDFDDCKTFKFMLVS